MFDFFIKYPISVNEIKEFLALTLECSLNKILIITSEELNNSTFSDEDLKEFCCLCIYSKVNGDASWLLNLYRISATEDEIENKIITTSQLRHIACYIPNDNFNGYLLVGEDDNPIQVYEDEDIKEENMYIFRKFI